MSKRVSCYLETTSAKNREFDFDFDILPRIGEGVEFYDESKHRTVKATVKDVCHIITTTDEGFQTGVTVQVLLTE